MAFPTVRVEQKWCAGDVAIPLAEAVEIEKLQDGVAEVSDEKFSTLSLKATAHMEWFLKACGLPSTWWREKHQSLALVKEVSESIRASKGNRRARFPKFHLAFISLETRGRRVFVRNDTRGLCFAVPEGEEKEFLDWLLKELSEDVAGVQRSVPVAAPRVPLPEETTEDRLVSKAVETLVNHSQCLKATFLPSRASIKVKREDKASGGQGVGGGVNFCNRETCQGKQ